MLECYQRLRYVCILIDQDCGVGYVLHFLQTAFYEHRSEAYIPKKEMEESGLVNHGETIRSCHGALIIFLIVGYHVHMLTYRDT